MSMASTSVSKTESPGSNPCAPANEFFGGRVWRDTEGASLERRGVTRV